MFVPNDYVHVHDHHDYDVHEDDDLCDHDHDHVYVRVHARVHVHGNVMNVPLNEESNVGMHHPINHRMQSSMRYEDNSGVVVCSQLEQGTKEEMAPMRSKVLIHMLVHWILIFPVLN